MDSSASEQQAALPQQAAVSIEAVLRRSQQRHEALVLGLKRRLEVSDARLKTALERLEEAHRQREKAERLAEERAAAAAERRAMSRAKSLALAAASTERVSSSLGGGVRPEFTTFFEKAHSRQTFDDVFSAFLAKYTHEIAKANVRRGEPATQTQLESKENTLERRRFVSPISFSFSFSLSLSPYPLSPFFGAPYKDRQQITRAHRRQERRLGLLQAKELAQNAKPVGAPRSQSKPPAAHIGAPAPAASGSRSPSPPPPPPPPPLPKPRSSSSATSEGSESTGDETEEEAPRTSYSGSGESDWRAVCSSVLSVYFRLPQLTSFTSQESPRTTPARRQEVRPRLCSTKGAKT